MRVEVALDEHGGQADRAELGPVAAARPVDDHAPHRLGVELGGEPAQVTDGISRDRPARIVRAVLGQDPRRRAPRVGEERVDPLRPHHGVEHEALDVVGIRAGVLLGDVGAVRGALDRQLVDAERLAHVLEVGDAVGGGVELATLAELGRTLRRERRGDRVEQAQALEVAAAQDPGVAGAALVEHDEPVAQQRGSHRVGDERRRGHAALTGAAEQ